MVGGSGSAHSACAERGLSSLGIDLRDKKAGLKKAFVCRRSQAKGERQGTGFVSSLWIQSLGGEAITLFL